MEIQIAVRNVVMITKVVHSAAASLGNAAMKFVANQTQSAVVEVLDLQKIQSAFQKTALLRMSYLEAHMF